MLHGMRSAMPKLAALAAENAQRLVSGKQIENPRSKRRGERSEGAKPEEIKKIVVVPGKLVNIVVVG